MKLASALLMGAAAAGFIACGSSCTQMPVSTGTQSENQPSIKLNSTTQPATKDTAKKEAAEQEESPAETVCPCTRDVRDSLDKFKKLLGDAELIAADAKKKRGSAQQDQIELEIDSWKRSDKAWRKRNENLLGGCYLLRSAEGYTVYPEIPISLKRLAKGEKQLASSISAVSASKFDVSERCLRRARSLMRKADNALAKRMRPQELQD